MVTKLIGGGNQKKALPVVAKALGIPSSTRDWFDFIEKTKLCELKSRDIEDREIEALKDIVNTYLKSITASDVVDYMAKRLRDYIIIPSSTDRMEIQEGGELVEEGLVKCSLCRSPIPSSLAGRFNFKMYRDALKSVGVGIAQEVFHPDAQGAPADTKVMDDVIKLPVCPFCYYEAYIMARYAINIGMWTAVIHYGPVISYHLFQAFRKAASQVREGLPVLADYLSAKIIVPYKTSDLTRMLLKDSFRLWYVIGGSLALTRTPTSLPTPVDRVLYIEKVDAVIESVDSMMRETLRRASEKGDYIGAGAHRVRLTAYQLLSMYVESLGEHRVEGKVRLNPSLRTPVFAPTLTVFSMYSRTRIEKRER
jgi:hypothetical protein